MPRTQNARCCHPTVNKTQQGQSLAKERLQFMMLKKLQSAGFFFLAFNLIQLIVTDAANQLMKHLQCDQPALV